ncbi:NB-ARC domain-containing protein [Actinomadura keratinilytica]
MIVVLDDASDAGQVAALVPEHSDSLVLVTAREPMELPEGTAARVRQLPVTALDAAGAEEVLRAAAGEAADPYDAQATDRIVELCGGLPLALRVAGSALAGRTPRELASALEAYGPVSPVERALWLRHTDQEEAARRCCGGWRWRGGPRWGRPRRRRCWTPANRRRSGFSACWRRPG